MFILTFDVEDWFHFLEHDSTRHESQWDGFEVRIHRNVERLLLFLESRNQRATFFTMGWIAGKFPDLIRKIAGAGHEIGLHSYGHQLIYDQSHKAFREDLIRNKQVLEDILGVQITRYRAPGFSIIESSLWAFDIMAETGITTDASIFPTFRAHGGLRSFPLNEPCVIDVQGYHIREFPINVVSLLGNRFVYSGGGYFRFFPYPLIRLWTKNTGYVMSYFHPRDFDTTQPVLQDLSLFRKFRGYYGLAGSMNKLDKWITEFPFISLNEAENLIDWKKVKIVHL